MSANKYALLIGSNYTVDSGSQLKGCINDIVNMRNVLVDAYGYPMENIRMLRDDTVDPIYHPTYDNIISELKDIALKSKTSSQVWIHYSGHGTQVTDFSEYAMEIENGLSDCIVPSDYYSSGFITQEQIYEIIKTIECPAYITIDACHSGSLCQLQWSYSLIDENKYVRTETSDVELSNKQIYMISGCRDSQVSADSFDAESQIYMGAFTDAFITCLRNAQHNINILMLYKEVCLSLSNAGFSQSPVLSSSTNDMSAHFIRSIF